MNTITIIILFGSGGYFIWAVGARLMRQNIMNLTYDNIDRMFKDEWKGTEKDELLAWYRVRSRVMELFPYIPRTAKETYLEALETRITQCRQRHTTFKLVDVKGGKPTLISTQN